VWKDYKHTNSIRTRPCMEMAFGASRVHSFTVFKGDLIVHHGTILERFWPPYNSRKLCEDLADNDSVMFIHDQKIYILDGDRYLCTDGTLPAEEVDGYVPTTSICRSPSGEENITSGGKQKQDINMIQRRRINTFRADGVSKVFWLNTYDIDKDFEPIVESLDGQKLSNYKVDYDKGTITFDEAPSVPRTDGADNISVEFAKTIEEYEKAIAGCTIVQAFDNRIFFSSNPDYPNTVFYSALDAPFYISDRDIFVDGLDDAKIKGMVAGNNALWVFREPSTENTTIFYHTPSVDA
jgi:hypothetical protein